MTHKVAYLQIKGTLSQRWQRDIFSFTTKPRLDLMAKQQKQTWQSVTQSVPLAVASWGFFSSHFWKKQFSFCELEFPRKHISALRILPETYFCPQNSNRHHLSTPQDPWETSTAQGEASETAFTWRESPRDHHVSMGNPLDTTFPWCGIRGKPCPPGGESLG